MNNLPPDLHLLLHNQERDRTVLRLGYRRALLAQRRADTDHRRLLRATRELRTATIEVERARIADDRSQRELLLLNT